MTTPGFTIFLLVVLDQISKLIFSARIVKNYGLGFSLDFGLLPNLMIISAALLFFIHYYFTHRKNLSRLGKIIFTLIVAGGLSNIIDRLYLGYVRDFLDFGLGFTFNFADAMIMLGLLLLFLVNMPIADET